MLKPAGHCSVRFDVSPSVCLYMNIAAAANWWGEQSASTFSGPACRTKEVHTDTSHYRGNAMRLVLNTHTANPHEIVRVLERKASHAMNTGGLTSVNILGCPITCASTLLMSDPDSAALCTVGIVPCRYFLRPGTLRIIILTSTCPCAMQARVLQQQELMICFSAVLP